ncbi:hypothetical protein ACU4GA_21215 [Methylobacterium oryzae CBMB20]
MAARSSGMPPSPAQAVPAQAVQTRHRPELAGPDPVRPEAARAGAPAGARAGCW